MRRLAICLVYAGRLLRAAAVLAFLVIVAWSLIVGFKRLRNDSLTGRDALAHFLFYPLGAAAVAAIGTLLGVVLVYLGESLIAGRAAGADGTERTRGFDTGPGRPPGAEAVIRAFREGTFTALLAVVALAVNGALVATFNGVVREHCLDAEASRQSGMVEVDSHWTYILWPPLMFAANDPPGRCVRNNPARVALDYLGIWSLPSPQAQVRRHIADQGFSFRRRDGRR